MTKNSSDQLIVELGSLYVLNTLIFADEEDEGGLDHPLETKYACIQPMLTLLSEKKWLDVQPYQEDGESGEEYVPTKKAYSEMENLVSQTDTYKKASGLKGEDALKQAFFLAMDSGQIARLDESDRPWYEQISSLPFYESLLGEGNEEGESLEAEAPEPHAHSPAPREFREEPSEDSAIEINELAEKIPLKSYRYIKPALIHGALGLVLLYMYSKGTGWAFYLGLVFCGLSLYYYLKRVTIGPQGVELSTPFGSQNIPSDEIAESILNEEDGDPKTLEIVGRNGVSFEVTHWLENFSGFRILLKRLAEES